MRKSRGIGLFSEFCSFVACDMKIGRYRLIELIEIMKLSEYSSFWSGNHFLIAPFPDLCLLVPF